MIDQLPSEEQEDIASFAIFEAVMFSFNMNALEEWTKIFFATIKTPKDQKSTVSLIRDQIQKHKDDLKKIEDQLEETQEQNQIRQILSHLNAINDLSSCTDGELLKLVEEVPAMLESIAGYQDSMDYAPDIATDILDETPKKEDLPASLKKLKEKHKTTISITEAIRRQDFSIVQIYYCSDKIQDNGLMVKCLDDSYVVTHSQLTNFFSFYASVFEEMSCLASFSLSAIIKHAASAGYDNMTRQFWLCDANNGIIQYFNSSEELATAIQESFSFSSYKQPNESFVLEVQMISTQNSLDNNQTFQERFNNFKTICINPLLEERNKFFSDSDKKYNYEKVRLAFKIASNGMDNEEMYRNQSIIYKDMAKLFFDDENKDIIMRQYLGMSSNKTNAPIYNLSVQINSDISRAEYSSAIAWLKEIIAKKNEDQLNNLSTSDIVLAETLDSSLFSLPETQQVTKFPVEETVPPLGSVAKIQKQNTKLTFFNQNPTLTEMYFGAQPQSNHTDAKIAGKFGDYLQNRANTYYVKDFMSTIAALFLGCFGYKTDLQVRKEYLLKKLQPVLNDYDNDSLSNEKLDKLLKTIQSGKQKFPPRNRVSNDSLLYLLKELEDCVLSYKKGNRYNGRFSG